MIKIKYLQYYFIFVIGMLIGCASSQNIPRTVEQAVLELKTKWLSKDDLDWILRNPKEHVCATLHLPFGVSVRNSWHLWSGNSELMESSGAHDPDGCTWIIFQKLWESVRKDADSVLVARLDCQFKLADSIKISYKGYNNYQIGRVIQNMQTQIDLQMSQLSKELCAENGSQLKLDIIGNPNLNCWTRAEFSEDGKDPMNLQLLLGWISWRNGFDVRYSPPVIQLTFRDSCAWNNRPNGF